jgi:photosystem II stability/assembly factor-like uncharacterized protein
MHVLCGTRQGVYRGRPGEFDDATRVLDSDRVMRIRQFGPRVYAATRSGLYRSLDGGDSWTRLETPQSEVYSVLEAPVGEQLFAGTHPAHLYVSTDGGDSWTERAGLQRLPSRETWHTPRHRNEAHVRSLGAVGADRLVAGIEVGGVHRSEDDGATWTERNDGVHDDIHHVLVRDTDHWVASTGNGLYRTRDAGQTWTRLDEALGNRYFREAFAHEGRLYAAATAGSPPTWGSPSDTDAALYESDDDGDSLRPVEYAGGPGAFVLSWAADDGNVYAGTTSGLVLRRDDDGWFGVGSVPSAVASLAAVAASESR